MYCTLLAGMPIRVSFCFVLNVNSRYKASITDLDLCMLYSLTQKAITAFSRNLWTITYIDSSGIFGKLFAYLNDICQDEKTPADSFRLSLTRQQLLYWYREHLWKILGSEWGDFIVSKKLEEPPGPGKHKDAGKQHWNLGIQEGHTTQIQAWQCWDWAEEGGRDFLL